MTVWDQWIARTNVARFRRLIDEERDPTKVRVLKTLLAREEAKLGDADDGPTALEQHEHADERPKDNAEHWRKKALVARRMADGATDPTSRQRLLDIAEGYDRLERLAEEALARRDLPEAK